MDVRIFLRLIFCGVAYGIDTTESKKKIVHPDFNLKGSVLNICRGNISQGFGYLIDNNNVLTVSSNFDNFASYTVQKGEICETDNDKRAGATKGQTESMSSSPCCHIKEEKTCESCIDSNYNLTTLKFAKIETQVCYLNTKEHHFGNAIMKNNQLCGLLIKHCHSNNEGCIDFVDIGQKSVKDWIDEIIHG